MRYRNIPFSPPDMTEAEANEVRDAILSGWITTGPRTKKFEVLLSEYFGVEKCVCLGSQTASAEMVLRLLGVGPGDEVIVPAYTYTASASVVSHVGAKLILIDAKKPSGTKADFSFEMDYDKMEDAITERTKVIIPVDLCGIPCDYDRVFAAVERKRNLFRPSNDIQKKFGRIIICADSAHAVGAKRKGKMVGAIADFSTFSFHAVKNFTTAEGGCACWNLPFGKDIVERQIIYNNSPIPFVDGETWNTFIYRLMQLFSLHGQNKDALAKTKLGVWEYDVIGPWYKCNMTDLSAAIGLMQLARYPDMLSRRKTIVEKYNDAFKNLNVAVLSHYTDEYEGSGHLYLVRLLGHSRNEVDKVIEEMAVRGISCNVHYKPLPLMTAYMAMGYDIKDFPNAYAIFENEITLPLNTKMTDEDVDYIIENFTDVVKVLNHGI